MLGRVHVPNSSRRWTTAGRLREPGTNMHRRTDRPPPPWSNLLVGESWAACLRAGAATRAGNARMTQFTPFRNDALTDAGRGRAGAL